MNQKELDILLKKYLDGTCNEQEEQKVLAWVALTDDSDLNLNSFEKKEIEKRIWLKIKTNLFRQSYFKYAASIAVLVCFGLLFYVGFKKDDFEKVENQNGVEMKNTSGLTQNLTLEDGSKVTLSPNSSLSYPTHFGAKTREVFLKGEAFFNIKHNAAKPFIVHAGNLSTEVLGTSFRIISLPNRKNTEVQVVTGRVSVFANAEGKVANGIILTPNQKVVFNKETKEIIPGILDKPRVLVDNNDTEELIFEDTTIKEVVAKLSKRYGIEIIIGNETLNNCGFTGDLNGILLNEQVAILCKTINARHEIRGTNIFVYGEGCK